MSKLLVRVAAAVCVACLAVACNKQSADQKGGDGNAAGGGSQSPKEVALAFAKAVRAGDTVTAKGLSVGNDSSYKALDVLVQTWKSMDGLVATVQAAAPGNKDAPATLRKEFEIPDDLDAQAKTAKETVTGDTAVVSGGDDDHEPVTLKKVSGQWKVDLDATMRDKRLTRDADLAAWKQVDEKMDQTAADIKSGKIKIEDFIKHLK